MFELLKRYKEMILYIIFGVLTTVINIFLFSICRDGLGFSILIANSFAWFWSVLFAYITNKKWVFESKDNQIAKEVVNFYLSRVATLLLETVLLFLLIETLGFNDVFSKIVSNVVVVVMNFVLSKIFVFKRN